MMKSPPPPHGYPSMYISHSILYNRTWLCLPGADRERGVTARHGAVGKNVVPLWRRVPGKQGSEGNRGVKAEVKQIPPHYSLTRTDTEGIHQTRTPCSVCCVHGALDTRTCPQPTAYVWRHLLHTTAVLHITQPYNNKKVVHFVYGACYFSYRDSRPQLWIVQRLYKGATELPYL